MLAGHLGVPHSQQPSGDRPQAPLVYRHLFPGFLGSPPFLVRLPLRRPGHAGCLPRHLAVFLLPEPAVTVTAPGLQDKRATPRPVEELTSFTSEAGVRTTASSEDEDTVSWFRAFERAYEGSPSQALYGAAADDKWIGCIVYTPYVRPVPVSVRCKPHHELQHCLDGITDGAPGVDRYLYNCCIPTKPRGHTGYCIVLRFPSTSRGGTERPLAAVIIASSRDASQAGSFDEIFPASPQPARQLAVLVACPSWVAQKVVALCSCLAGLVLYRPAGTMQIATPDRRSTQRSSARGWRRPRQRHRLWGSPAAAINAASFNHEWTPGWNLD